MIRQKVIRDRARLSPTKLLNPNLHAYVAREPGSCREHLAMETSRLRTQAGWSRAPLVLGSKNA
ncbi:MAG TPA: hypothetical protein VFQ61_14645 [Polyangiaceae bacterium]|nr:hypothetical protein [Polyangiaceae bacterium]